jgi:NitT/TauT family transport system ATP-binding protein
MSASAEAAMSDAVQEATRQSRKAIELDHVTVTYPAAGTGQSYTAIKNFSMTVEDGEFLSVVGPTGCGKSTILNVLAGLLAPTAGAITVFGERLRGINRRAGYLFQSDATMPWRTVLRNVVAPLEVAGVPEPERSTRGRAWLARVGLRGKDALYQHQLSGGMRRRMALAQVMIANPQMILMDEPFSALDVQTRTLMENELLELWSQERKSVVFITHDLDEAIALSDRVLVLSAGPETHPIGEFTIHLPRPRDVAEIRSSPEFARLYGQIWDCMRPEVLKSYRQSEDP